jgi:hypothetical protein
MGKIEENCKIILLILHILLFKSYTLVGFDPVSSVAGVDATTRPRRQVNSR